MPKCDEILSSVLSRRGLDRPDGHPLYAYKITTKELDLLRSELQNRLTIAGKFRTPEECAAFCLFGAEWFRRFYDRGVWAWRTIFEGLGIEIGRQLDNLKQHVGEFTMDGLHWWRVDLIQTHLSYRYLTTLVCQGGFPINTLKNDGAGLSRYLEACLRDHERYPNEPMSEITEQYINYVPSTLNNAEVKGLVGEMVRSIADLRKQSEDATNRGASRFEYLEQNYPNWEKGLPIRVEQPEAKELLISLLDVARSQPFSNRQISVSTTLNLGQAEGSIARHLRFPSSLSDGDFRRLMGFTSDENILPRMTGFLHAGELRIPCINIARNHDGTRFRLNKLGTTSLAGAEAYQKTSLDLAVGGQEIKTIDLPGGEELPESPWVFVDEDTGSLIGVGSVKPRDESVIVAIPEGCDVSVDPEGTDVEKLTMQVAGRTVLRLSGAASFYIDDISFRVTTRSEAEEAFLYELRGNRRRLGTGGSNVWIGMPTVFEIPVSEDGVATEIATERVEWRPAHGGEWKTRKVDCIGEVLLRVQDEGTTRFLTKATVLPGSFNYQIIPGRKSGEGQIKLRGLGSVNIYVERTELAQLNAERTEEGQVIDVVVPGERPNLLNFRLRFSNGNQCHLSFICPTEYIGIVNAVGETLNPSHGIPVEQVDGLNLQVIKPGGGTPLVYESNYGQLVDAARETKVDGVYELPLSYVKNHATEMLALSSDPDSEVSYEVQGKNSLRSMFGFKIARYGSTFIKKDPDENLLYEDTTEFFLPTHLISDELSNLNVEVSPLGRPKEKLDEETIKTIGQGRWRINHKNYPPGYYLITARKLNGECLRPIRFVVKPEELNELVEHEPTSDSLFDHVLNIRDLVERQAAWDEFFNNLVQDHSHPGWQRVGEMLEASYEVPITTYETVAALTRNPEAVARFGILEPHNSKLWQRLEQLPFLWSLIPFRAWLKTARSTLNFVRDSLKSVGFDDQSKVEELIRQRSDAFVSEAPNRIPSMACVAVCLWNSGFQVNPTLLRMSGQSQIEGLSLQDRICEQARLIDQKTRFDTRRTWPNFELDVPDSVNKIFDSTKDLAILDTHPNQKPVLNGPAIAAVHTVYDIGVSMDQVCQFKRLRALDQDWYDKANAIATFILMQRRFEEEPEAFRDEDTEIIV